MTFAPQSHCETLLIPRESFKRHLHTIKHSKLQAPKQAHKPLLPKRLYSSHPPGSGHVDTTPFYLGAGDGLAVRNEGLVVTDDALLAVRVEMTFKRPGPDDGLCTRPTNAVELGHLLRKVLETLLIRRTNSVDVFTWKTNKVSPASEVTRSRTFIGEERRTYGSCVPSLPRPRCP